MKRIFQFLATCILLSGASIAAKVVQISDEKQLQDAMKNNKNMVIAYSADWCNVCNSVKEPFEQVSQDPEFKQVAFAQVDVDKLEDVSKKNGIVGVPTFVFVENGAKKVEEIGVQNMPEFKNHLKDNIRKNFQLAQNDMKELQREEVSEETSDVASPAQAPVAEPNIFVKVFVMIKNFVLMIFAKIVEFFTTVIDAIKGFFGM